MSESEGGSAAVSAGGCGSERCGWCSSTRVVPGAGVELTARLRGRSVRVRGGRGGMVDLIMALRSGTVAAVLVVAGHSVAGDDGARQRRFAGEYHGGADLGELVDVAGAVAAEQFEAFALRGE